MINRVSWQSKVFFIVDALRSEQAASGQWKTKGGKNPIPWNWAAYAVLLVAVGCGKRTGNGYVDTQDPGIRRSRAEDRDPPSW